MTIEQIYTAAERYIWTVMDKSGLTREELSAASRLDANVLEIRPSLGMRRIKLGALLAIERQTGISLNILSPFVDAAIMGAKELHYISVPGITHQELAKRFGFSIYVMNALNSPVRRGDLSLKSVIDFGEKIVRERLVERIKEFEQIMLTERDGPDENTKTVLSAIHKAKDSIARHWIKFHFGADGEDVQYDPQAMKYRWVVGELYDYELCEGKDGYVFRSYFRPKGHVSVERRVQL